MENSSQQTVENSSPETTTEGAGETQTFNEVNTQAEATPDVTITDGPAPEAPAQTTQNWYESLESVDLKSHPKIQEFKNADGLAKSYLELQSMINHEKVPLPKDENDEVAIANLNKALGVPEEASQYELNAPEAPEGLEGMAFGTERFAEIAHQHNLTNAQAQGLQDAYVGILNEIQSDGLKAYEESVKTAKNELLREWGVAYDAKVKLAQDVMNKFSGGKEAFDHINAKIGNDPVALKFLAEVGSKFSEGSMGDTGLNTSRFTKTPSEAKAEYDKIMNDPKDIYWAGVRNSDIVTESARKERVSYVESLLQMQHPQGQAE